ncbi:two-component sensor histidine kinase [Sporocytophaga myxococcoides]|uniref:Two-component sensor histidine kinase n=1 Tax=Sporocytophaga myxococcoides TaxID=153721 RepID=A0A098LEK0_9BACT|nr:ATP-binding protein [Sporocytophaga myxococcoides]GAL84703.1 two-component sensor histidine kinase [Sporocytophaga myxococcoides]
MGLFRNKLNTLGQEQRLFKYSAVMYAIALSLIAVISILSQVLIQQYLSSQIHDSHIINIAARQRTYSQTLSKNALLIESGRDIETNRKAFVNTLRQWQRSHEALQSGSDFLNLPANDREELSQMFKIIEDPYEEILGASNEMIKELYSTKPLDSLNLKPYITTIFENEKIYLLGMELIVFDYDRFSRNGVNKLKEIEYILLFIVLLSLVLEAVFIFYPLALRVRQNIRDLVVSETNAKNLANKLKETNDTLEQSHKELREVNFALEKATYLVKTDQDGRIIYANDKYCHVTKYTMGELLGKPLFYNNMGGKESIIYEHVRNPLRRKEVWQGEIFDHASDGTGFWLDVTLMPIVDYKGSLYQYLVICTDITKRKNTERELTLLTEEKIRRQDVEQKIISYSILNGQEKERKRIAAEIHDGIGQMMTSMRMKLEMIEQKNIGLSEDLPEINDLLQSIINETKKICSDLLPSVLDDFGLSAAVRELQKLCESSSTMDLEIEDQLAKTKLPREVEIGVFRILQEALNNAIKHSSGSKIFVHVSSDVHCVHLMVQDDGKGFYFDERRILSREFVRKSNGLRNMKERAELLGGNFNVTSEPGKGTIVQLEIPL